jgi:hypothetical protein
VPTVATLSGMAIMFFYNDHDPPHFHVEGADFSAKIALADLSVAEVRGQVRSRDLRRLREWAVAHRADLWENWLRARRKEPLLRIGG